MSTLLIYFECNDSDFGPLMAAIGPNMPSIQNLRVEAAKNREGKTEETASLQSKRGRQYHGRKSGSENKPDPSYFKNSKLAKLLIAKLEAAGRKGCSQKELMSVLEDAGYAPTSVSPALSNLCRADMIVRGRGGHATLKSALVQ